VTDHWATTVLAGPKSRTVLQALCQDVDFDDQAFPFMSYREGTVAGVRARIMRISFSGERSYEINVPAQQGLKVWEAIHAAGKPHGITPYGTETMHVLRAEKGYIIVGQDTDGSVSPMDLGMGGMVAKTKDFLGRRSLSRSDTVRANRKQLVGLLTENPQEVLPEGSQILAGAFNPPPALSSMQGHVTSSYHSPALKRSIAMALVQGGLGRMGETVQVALRDGRNVNATITSPVFYDPNSERQNA
jgi:sarcosine oxidase subunit alpha